MKKLLLTFVLLLVVATQTYGQIPEEYRQYKQIECKLKPIKRGERRFKNDFLSPLLKLHDASSLNWSGYVAATNLATPQNRSVNSVSGSWVVPKLQPTTAKTNCSIWVGIDGYVSNSVEQIGTEHDWINGQQRNYAWFEMFPKAAYKILNFPCRPGHLISAEVVFKGNGTFQLVIFNTTKQVYFFVPTSYTTFTGAKRSSAEWIVEAPSKATILPLANFGTVQFTNCSAKINGVSGSINDSHWVNDSITMETSDDIVKAQPSSLSSNGSSFSVTWFHQ